MDMVELVVAVHAHLDDADVVHAFGGALALAYVAEPRGTVDIDVNVFLPATGLQLVYDALAPLGLAPHSESNPLAGIGGSRLVHHTDPFPVDVFPSLHERYSEVARRRVLHPFGQFEDVLPFLSAEDLCMFKLSFGRLRDWADLEAVALARPALDIEYVEEQLIALRGPTMYPRVARFRGMLRSA